MPDEECTYFERQVALEKQALVELLLDFYESKLGRQAHELDAIRGHRTMKERSKQNEIQRQ